MRCPACDHDNDAERRFCAECGAALATLCAACGASNKPGVKFCGGCGAPLKVESRRSRVESFAPVSSPCEHDSRTRDTTEGERRQLTVLFSDLVGSTELSTQLDPEEWRDRVAQYHRVTAETVEKFGGQIGRASCRERVYVLV